MDSFEARDKLIEAGFSQAQAEAQVRVNERQNRQAADLAAREVIHEKAAGKTEFAALRAEFNALRRDFDSKITPLLWVAGIVAVPVVAAALKILFFD